MYVSTNFNIYGAITLKIPMLVLEKDITLNTVSYPCLKNGNHLQIKEDV